MTERLELLALALRVAFWFVLIVGVSFTVGFIVGVSRSDCDCCCDGD